MCVFYTSLESAMFVFPTFGLVVIKFIFHFLYLYYIYLFDFNIFLTFAYVY